MTTQDLTVAGLLVTGIVALFAYVKIIVDRSSATEAKRAEDAQKAGDQRTADAKADGEQWRQLSLSLLASEEKRTQVLIQMNNTLESLRQALQARR